MTEKLLQFIWQFGYFNKQQLQSSCGQQVFIILPGTFNSNQGPDFSEARIRIEQTVWAGSIELHVRASDWKKHAHQHDRNYGNVILHVVWEDDGYRPDPEIPLLELQQYVPKLLLHQYDAWMNNGFFIPCGEQLSEVSPLIWINWKDRLLVERLMRKSGLILRYLDENNQHWEETFWWLIARNFGIPVNAEAFEAIAKSLPQKLLARHKRQIHQLEALLLGQSGLLDRDFTDDYPLMLQREYRFLQKKYKLTPISLPLHFLRMRPVNFPTIRLAQLAMLVQKSSHLFSTIKEIASLKELIELFTVTANDYWHYHYSTDKDSGFKPKKTGRPFIDNIIINTIGPLMFAYGHIHKEETYKLRALSWLNEITAEKNALIRGFQQLNIPVQHASDSQSLIELKTQYCDKKRCLECAAGNALLKRKL